VGVLSHGLLETVGNDLTHAADGEILIAGSGGGGGSGLSLLNILLGDDTTTAGTLDALDGHALLKGKGLGGGADRGLTVETGLELLVGVLGLDGGGRLRSRGGSSGLGALGLLLLLSGGGLVTTSISQGKRLEGGDIGTFLNEDGDRLKRRQVRSNPRGEIRKNSYRTDSDILLTAVLQNLGEDTLVLELEVHLSLIGLDLNKDITGLESISGLLLPHANVSRGHSRRERRHANDCVGRESYAFEC
jgi:hypothetical protein